MPALPLAHPAKAIGGGAFPRPAVTGFRPVPATAAVGHNLMLLAGLSQMPLPPALAALMGRGEGAGSGSAAGPLARPGRLANGRHSRWSADGWIMLRRDGSGPVVPARAGYGRSQAGAVLRYRLSPAATGLQAYLRGTGALAGPAEREVALGLAARPHPALPVRLHAELRVADRAGGAHLRPGLLAVTELPPLPLPLGARAQAYVQAGYVGGRDATAFVDGQARIDRPLTGAPAGAGLRAGAAVWGGAQQGTARFDIGPTASLELGVGGARSTLAVDYRIRVAGTAMPASGPAITLSAGF